MNVEYVIILIGKTCSGKTILLNKLVEDYKFKKITTYTTRPMRPDETQNITYHFISEDDFKHRIDSGFFAEWKTYNTVFGLWYYGTALEDLENADDKTAIILTPDGYRDIVSKLSKKPKVIYIYANNSTIKQRLLSREDDKDEAQRRLEHDNIDFKGVENEVDRIFYNNKDNYINDVAKDIVSWLGRENIY